MTDSPELVELRGRPGARSPLLVGLVLLAGLAVSLIAAAERPMTPMRWVATLALGAAAAGLVRVGIPRPRTVRIYPGRRLVSEGGKRTIPIDDAAARYRLGPAPPRHATAAIRYGVWLGQPDRAPVLLLAGSDPARVLLDLASLRGRVPLPVNPGWGLPPGSTWADGTSFARPGPPGAAGPGASETREARQRITTTLLVGAAAVGTVLLVELLGRPAPVSPLRLLSVVLPLLSIALVVLFGLIVRSEGTRLTVGDQIVSEQRVLGILLRRRALPRGQVRAAHAVGPSVLPPQHLLLETDEGPVALRGEPEDILLAQEALFCPPLAQSSLPSMRRIPGEQIRS